MRAEKVIILIKNPNTIKETSISDLENMLLKFPYFQIGQLLLTRGLLNTESIRYNKQLKMAAAYSAKRNKLFNLITLNKNSLTDANIIVTKTLESTEERLELGKPLHFSKDETHSFSEWLTLLNIKKIKRKRNSMTNNFLKKQRNISTEKKEIFFKAARNSKQSLVENNDLITPTLAKVYLEQEHYQKAISAYKKLSLKYPKKSSFFAAQIKLINKLNKK